MPKLNLAKPWWQYGYFNCPENILTDHSSRQRRKIWSGRPARGHKGLKAYSPEERKQIVAEWKAFREKNGGFDFMHGGDACGPTAVGMVMEILGEKIDQREIVHAKHTLAYFKEGHPETAETWVKFKHEWDAGKQTDRKSKVKNVTPERMDAASPKRLMRMTKHLLGIRGDEYKWVYEPGMDNPPFESEQAAYDFLCQCIDNGFPVIVSYLYGPCTGYSWKGSKISLQGSSGHYVVVIGYEGDKIIVADPACGQIEKLPKNWVLDSPKRFKGAKKDATPFSQDCDGGFMGAWKRKGYRHLVIKSRNGSAPKKDPHSVNTQPVKVPKKEPLENVEPQTLSFDTPATGLKRVQYQLSRLLAKDGSGPYYTKKIDGLYGKGTKAGVRGFQKDHELKVDGIPGKNTVAMLEMVWVTFIAQEVSRVAQQRAEKAPPPESPGSPEIVHGRWSNAYAKLGDRVTVEIETKSIEDGTPITLEIWERDLVGADDFIMKLSGTVDSSMCRFLVHLNTSDDEWGEFGENSFYFIAKAAGVSKKFQSMLSVDLG